jgi:hypothetical protein
MSYAIVGFGQIGQALAHAFARKNIDVTVTSRRPGTHEAIAREIPAWNEGLADILASSAREYSETRRAITWECFKWDRRIIDLSTTMTRIDERRHVPLLVLVRCFASTNWKVNILPGSGSSSR